MTKIYRIKLDKQGYANNGYYYGIESRLYWTEIDGKIIEYRARDLNHARKIVKMWKNALLQGKSISSVSYEEKEE